jgi:hypothetical protein
MKALNVAFVWHMHQLDMSGNLRFPLIGPLAAALLTFPGFGFTK